MRVTPYLLFTLFAGLALAGGDPPKVQFTSVPTFGSANGAIQGVVSNVDPSAYRAAVFIFLDGLGWFSKPTCTGDRQDLVAVQSNGSFSAAIVTGGVDAQATQIRVYLVPAVFAQPCVLNGGGIPAATEQASVAHAIVDRPNVDQKVLIFANRRWLVKSSTVPVGPGPNIFDEANAFVDDQQRLHLRIHHNGANWTCAEVYLEDSLGYGTYQFVLDSPVDHLAGNAVLGLFTWSNDPAQAHREIDVEFGFNRAGDPSNAQYVIQPYDVAGNLQRFQVPAGAGATRHRFVWQAGRVDFDSSAGAGPIAQWTRAQGVPTAGDEVVHLNAWLENGNPPADGNDIEVIVSDFRFTPLNSPSAPPRVNRIVNGAAFSARLAPGSLFTLFGSGFSEGVVTAGTVPLPATLGNVQVSVNGSAVPLFFVSPTQVNGQIPYAVASGTATLSVQSNGVSSDTLAFQVEPAAPGTFVFGANRCLAGNAGGVVGPGNPAHSDTYATVYLSGQGNVDHPVPTGAAAPATPLSLPLATATANLGGLGATLQYFGLAPFMVGVAQANVLIPPLPLGDHEFILTMGQLTSNPCLLRAGDDSIRPAPQVLSIVPPTGLVPGGTSVAIYGRDFVSGATVRFGPSPFSPAAFTNSSVLQATTPAGTPGAVDVVVQNPDGQAGTLRAGFTYAAPPPPGLIRLDPASGPAKGGTPVKLFGTNFQPGILVRFGGQLAGNIVVNEATELQATTPAGTAGAVDVQVTNPDGQSATLRNAFMYVQAPAPHLVSIAPVSGPEAGGTSVTMTGTGFVSGMQVRFGSNQATGVSVTGTNSASATTPSGTGTVDVQVINPDGQSDTLRSAFSYQAQTSEPVITAVVNACKVSGQVLNLSDPAAYRVVVYAATNQLYLQPCVTEPLQGIQSNGVWGPVDLHSGTVSAVLVRSGYSPAGTLSGLPAVDGVNVFAVVTAATAASGCDVARCPAR